MTIPTNPSGPPPLTTDDTSDGFGGLCIVFTILAIIAGLKGSDAWGSGFAVLAFICFIVSVCTKKRVAPQAVTAPPPTPKPAPRPPEPLVHLEQLPAAERNAIAPLLPPSTTSVPLSEAKRLMEQATDLLESREPLARQLVAMARHAASIEVAAAMVDAVADINRPPAALPPPNPAAGDKITFC